MKDSDVAETPPHLLEEIRQLVGVDAFTLDVCASPSNAVCKRYYALEEGSDGLRDSWFMDGPCHVWCNPPYSDITPWISKAYRAWFYSRQKGTITMLLPANRTEQPWFQAYVQPTLDSPGEYPIIATFLPRRRNFYRHGVPIVQRDREGRAVLDAKGKTRVGSPKFGLLVLHWSSC